MWTLLLLILLAAPSLGNQCGVSKNSPVTANHRIVNGEESPKGAWPWIVSLSENGKHMCGGSIIADQWILTAAHCFPGADPNDWSVAVGEHELQTTSDDNSGHRATHHAIHKIFSHPLYHGDASFYDITLLKLKRPLTYTDRVQPICLPHPFIVFDEFEPECYAAGWGNDMGTSANRNVLQHVHSEIVNHAQCNSIYSMNIVEGNICFGDGRKGTCGGDSGGPLMCRRDGSWILAGLTSWGTVRCQGKPGVFTKVNYYHDWIQEIMYKN